MPASSAAHHTDCVHLWPHPHLYTCSTKVAQPSLVYTSVAHTNTHTHTHTQHTQYTQVRVHTGHLFFKLNSPSLFNHLKHTYTTNTYLTLSFSLIGYFWNLHPLRRDWILWGIGLDNQVLWQCFDDKIGAKLLYKINRTCLQRGWGCHLEHLRTKLN